MGDTITIVLTGVANSSGQGRQTQVVNFHGELEAFLDNYGAKVPASKPLTEKELVELAASNPEKLKQVMAKKTNELLHGAAKNMPQRIVDAVCNYLKVEKGFVISESDPGSDKFYIAPGDIAPTKHSIPNDGFAWHVTGVAPFG